MSPSPLSAPWSLEPEAVFSLLQSNAQGISQEEANHRLDTQGKNEINRDGKTAGWKIFLNQFKSPLVLILVAASGISLCLGEVTQTSIIFGMVFLGGILGFVQEYRSEQALRQLRQQLGHVATVVRNGKIQTIKAEDIVVGDLVEFELGSIIPADIRLLETNDLELDESSLTGESEPVPKNTQILSAQKTTPQELSCMVFAGTHVVQGSGKGIVIATGQKTMVGKTASLLTVKTDETSFQKGLRDFGNFLLKMTIVLALAVFLLLGFIHGKWAESLLFALALAVGISPELLPVIVTINLSRGALAMGKKFVLIKRLSAIEDLGNATVFCTDKTGTLTVGKLRVRDAVDIFGKSHPTILSLAANCLDIDPRGKASNSIDEAILDATAHIKEQQKRIDLISFDFTRRRMSCVLEQNQQHTLITKGAVAEVVSASTKIRLPSGECTLLTEKERQRIQQLADQFHDQGYRAIAIASRAIDLKTTYSAEDEHDLELLGFILVSDAPKETAASALKDLQDLGTRIVILTGDNERVTRHVAEQLGLKLSRIFIGEEIDRMDDVELRAAVKGADAFARITPSHKLRIVQAIKASGQVVGFMGDGINDAPALRAADVGISFQDATDVAKEAAAVILLRKNLSVLADGIKEGRRTFVNTRTYIRATIASNFGNMLSVAGAALLLPFIPLLPAQILLLNLLTDLPMLAISTDKVADEDIKKPKRWDIREISNFMYYFGSISSLADYATFAVLLFIAQADTAQFRSAWFIESALTEIIVIFLLRSHGRSWKTKPSSALICASALTVGIAILFTQTHLGEAFELVPVHGKIFLALILIVAIYAGLTEIGKDAYHRFKEKTIH